MAKIKNKKDSDKDILRKSFKFRCYPNKWCREMLMKAYRVLGDIWCNAIKDRDEKNGPWNHAFAEKINTFREKNKREPTDKERKVIVEQVNEIVKREVFSFKQQYHLVSQKIHRHEQWWMEKYSWLNAQVRQDALQRLDEAIQGYYGLRKNGDIEARKPGRKQYHTCITYHQSGWKLDGNILVLTGIGRIRMRLHRPIEGRIKTVSVIEKNRKWYVCFSCECEKNKGCVVPCTQPNPLKGYSCVKSTTASGGSDPEKTGTDNSRLRIPVGIYDGSDPEKTGTDNMCRDVAPVCRGGSDPEKWRKVKIAFGLRDNIFIADSDGRVIEHPMFYQNCIRKIAKLNRRLDRKVIEYICVKCGHKHNKVPTNKVCKGCGEYLKYKIHKSKNWHKANYTLEKYHEKLANKRKYFLENWAKFYVTNYDEITIPKWPLKKQIEYSFDNKTAINLTDGSYGKFVQMLIQKCQEYGKDLIVGPENKILKSRAKKLDEEKARLKKVKRVLKKTNAKLRKEAV